MKDRLQSEREDNRLKDPKGGVGPGGANSQNNQKEAPPVSGTEHCLLGACLWNASLEERAHSAMQRESFLSRWTAPWISEEDLLPEITQQNPIILQKAQTVRTCQSFHLEL
ncbi:unnamed protein product [Natator depressus]